MTAWHLAGKNKKPSVTLPSLDEYNSSEFPSYFFDWNMNMSPLSEHNWFPAPRDCPPANPVAQRGHQTWRGGRVLQLCPLSSLSVGHSTNSEQ